jgi:hypothetical protein
LTRGVIADAPPRLNDRLVCKPSRSRWKEIPELELFDELKHQDALERPEHRLLLWCARTRHTSDTKAALRDLSSQTMDWDYLTETAFSHGVMPLLYRSLDTAAASCVPSAIRQKLRLRFLANACRNHFLVMELTRIVEQFRSAGIAAVPFKGPVLAISVYGDVALRQFCDLDILIHRRDVITARDVLNSANYANSYGIGPAQEAALIGLQKDLQLTSRTHGTIVELHWSLDPERRFHRFSDVTVWDRLTQAHLEGKNVPSLSAEDLFLYLCAHGANHCWDRLSWVSDVAEVLASHPSMNWELVLHEAKNLGVMVRMLLGLSLAGTLLSAPVPEHLERMAADRSPVRKTVALVVQRLFASSASASRLRRTFDFHLRVRDSFSDRVRLCLRRVAVPDAMDLQWLPLSSSLAWLLFVLRPLRLLAKHLPIRRGGC